MLPTMYKDGNAVSIEGCFGIGATQTIDGTSVSTQSSVIDANNPSIVYAAALGNCWVNIGTNPTSVAESAGAYFPSGHIRLLSVPKGYKLSVIGAKLNIVVCY